MSEDLERTSRARRAAELALVRVCSHYGQRPNFVLLGGLVPAMLCSDSGRLHAGTTDVDVQVDLEIAGGAENARRLEIALKNADFHVDSERVWRWETRHRCAARRRCLHRNHAERDCRLTWRGAFQVQTYVLPTLHRGRGGGRCPHADGETAGWTGTRPAPTRRGSSGPASSATPTP